MKISFLGDVEARPCPPAPADSDLCIQVGDYGYGFRTLDSLQKYSAGWKIIRGNHDDPAEARKDQNYLGDFGYLDKYDLFYLSGAWSIDWERRTPGLNWWEDEQLNPAQLEEAYNLYTVVKPKIVVTHEAPITIGQMILDQKGNRAIFGNEVYPTRTGLALQKMFESWQPIFWVFGHYHEPFKKQVNNTEFICVNYHQIQTLNTESYE